MGDHEMKLTCWGQLSTGFKKKNFAIRILTPEVTLSSWFAAISLYLSYATLHQRLEFSSDMTSVWRPQTAGGHSQRAPAIWDVIRLSWFA